MLLPDTLHPSLKGMQVRYLHVSDGREKEENQWEDLAGHLQCYQVRVLNNKRTSPCCGLTRCTPASRACRRVSDTACRAERQVGKLCDRNSIAREGRTQRLVLRIRRWAGRRRTHAAAIA